MSLRTTLLLLVLIGTGGLVLWFGAALGPWLHLTPEPLPAAPGDTLGILQNELTDAKITRLDVHAGAKEFKLERGGDWTLPGKWPTRKHEVEELVTLLTTLRSRFAPIPVNDEIAIAKYGIPKPPPSDKKTNLEDSGAVVTAWVGDKGYRLAFGEERNAGDANRFSQSTYLRLDEQPEVVRLAPGILRVLQRPVEYYQQRRLFIDTERVAKPDIPAEKTEQLAALSVAVDEHKSDGVSFTLKRADGEWNLAQPVRDRVDPAKVAQVLEAIADLWAEQFVDKPKADLAEYGLKEPEQTLTVTRPNGDVVVLQIGKKSDTKKARQVTRPAPPGLGLQPMTESVVEEFRYAKLQNNGQIFEVKDRTKDIFLAANDLRDPRLARFEPKEAVRVALNHAGAEMVLLKEKEKEKPKDPPPFPDPEPNHWRLEKPIQAEADATKVTELLESLAGLEARPPDILDGKDTKGYGLGGYGLADPVSTATVTITVEQDVKGPGETKSKKGKTFTFRLGKEETEKAKFYVQVEGNDRVNLVDSGVAVLVKRPALAYRGRRVLDFSTATVDTLEIDRAGEKITLKQDKGAWKLLTPSQADADGLKAGQVAGNLSRLEAVEYVNEKPQPDELEKLYGLDKPALQATIKFADAGTPTRKLLLGKQRENRPEYFAKLEEAPGVFVVRKDLHDSLDQASLAYRPLQLWQVLTTDVTAVRIQKEGQEEYTLKRQGTEWHIAGPFDATAVTALAQPAAEQLAGLRCERYETATADDLAKFGLDKPYVRVAVGTAAKNGIADKPKERTLLIGKPTGPDAQSRYAKLGDAGEKAVFIVGEKLVSAIEYGALDLLDPHLLALAKDTIDSLHITVGESPLTLQRKGPNWSVLESPAPEFPADKEAINEILKIWSDLRAQSFAAYGPKADPAKFGLDKPALTANVRIRPAAAEGEKAEPVDHTLIVGKPIAANGMARYARLDNGPGIVTLNPSVEQLLSRTYLDYVDRTVFQLDAGKVNSLVRKSGPDRLEIAKNDEGWQLLQPTAVRADDETLQTLVEQLSNLRSIRVAAYPAKDLKPFGLDAPKAEITLRIPGADGKPGDRTLKLGAAADEASGDRFALVDGGQTVFVLSGSLANRLTAAPLAFRNRDIARFPDADRAVLERGSRKAVFTKVEGTWKLTDPLSAEAEHTELEEFLFGKGGVSKLQADELVAEKPADLKPFGLDKPEARWHFFAGDKEVMNLAIGSRDKAGHRCYAQVAGTDLVFLLNPSLTTRALAEYRTRSVWTVPPDAAMIDEIHFTYANKPFVLEKAGASWSVAGKPDEAVNTRAVNETLAALAELKVERFVVDKNADLALYGLEKPHLILELQTPTGKRILHVGRAEGESKRYYTQVPEKSKGEVFVLSEADSAKIVRDVAAFTQSK